MDQTHTLLGRIHDVEMGPWKTIQLEIDNGVLVWI
jgi:hypothetical protein